MRVTIVILPLAAMPLPVTADDQTLLLEVHVNGYSAGTIGEFTLRNGALEVRRSDLGDLGLRIPSSMTAGPDEFIPLSQLTGVNWRLDQANQAIYFTAPDSLLQPAQLAAGGGGSAGATPIQSGAGITLDYDISGSMTGGQKAANGLFDARAFSLWGVVNSGFLVRAGSDAANSTDVSFIRLDTAAQYSDVDTLRRYTIGDFVSDGLSWTRPVRLAGAQIRSDFSMEPDLITYPLPTLSGAAAVPSTMDVFANGVRLFSGHVAPGPFQIPQLPVVSGAGTISMTLTNALGDQIASTMPFYTSPTLLEPGLQTYSVQSGMVRRFWGLLSNDYGDQASSVIYRRGLTPALTIEATVETTPGMAMGGSGVVLNVFDLAVIDAAAAFSDGLGHVGSQFSFGIQRIGPVWTYGGTATFADRHYLDIATMNGDPAPVLQLTGNLGLSLGVFGALGIAYSRIDRSDTPDVLALLPPANVFTNQTLGGINYLAPVQRARLLSASYSVEVGNMSFYATTYHSFSLAGGDGAMFSVTVPLGPRSSASADLGESSSGGFGQLQAQQSVVSNGDWGYQAYASGGDGTHEFGQVQYKSRYALFSAGADHSDGQTSLRVESQGAFSVVEGSFFGSNTIQDSFALVKTDGLPGVHVLQENRDVGTTNYRGMLVVPDLRSFEINHLAIRPDDIPLDVTIDQTARDVRPQDRSGVVVSFPVKISHGALLQLLDKAGKQLPVGSTVTLLATGAVFPVGYDGEAYIRELSPHNALVVEEPDGQRCNVAFDYVAVRGEIPKIGPLKCGEGAH